MKVYLTRAVIFSFDICDIPHVIVTFDLIIIMEIIIRIVNSLVLLFMRVSHVHACVFNYFNYFPLII